MEQKSISDKGRQYIELFEKLRQSVSDEQTAVAILQEIGKDGRVEKMRGFPETTEASLDSNGEQPATSKQLGFLRRLGVKVPQGISKLEASRLIDDAQARAIAA